MKNKKLLPVIIPILVILLGTAILSSENMFSNKSADTHQDNLVEVKGPGPSVTISTKNAENGDIIIKLTTKRFTFTPVPPENPKMGHYYGHAHLDIDGGNMVMLYKPDHRITQDMIKAGNNNINVVLNNVEHKTYAKSGKPISATFLIWASD